MYKLSNSFKLFTIFLFCLTYLMIAAVLTSPTAYAADTSTEQCKNQNRNKDSCVYAFTQGYTKGRSGQPPPTNISYKLRSGGRVTSTINVNKPCMDDGWCSNGYNAGLKKYASATNQTCNLDATKTAVSCTGKTGEIVNGLGNGGLCADGTDNCAAPNSSSGKDQADCDAAGSGFGLAWIACPVIDAGVGMTDWVFSNLIEPLLRDVPISTDGAYYKAWQTFRIFGNIILVGALLLMVFAQNFGRFVDAYTVKRMAPRVVVGAITINLSIYIAAIAVSVVTVIGSGIGDILVAPFANGFDPTSKGIKIESSNIEGIGLLGAGFLTALLGAGGAIFIVANGLAGAAAVAVIGLLLPVIISIVLIAIAILFTLIIRQALIIFLVIISPVAIALFILPNTEKYFRQWWNLFLKTLLVYPIISILFAMSNVMIIILLSASVKSGDSIGVAQIIAACIIAFAPLALIPFSFKFAGGAIGAVMNAAQGVASNMSARARKGIETSREDPNKFLGRGTHAWRAGREKHGLYAGSAIGALNQGRKNRAAGGTFREGWSSARSKERDAKARARDAFMAQNSIYHKEGSQVDEAQMDMARYGSSAESLRAIQDGSHISYGSAHRETARRIANGETVSDEDRTSYETRQSQLRSFSALNDKQGRTFSSRVAASKSAAALSYGYSSGEEGWNQAVDIAQNLYGEGNEADIMGHLNELQYVAGQVGRSDLSGNVNSLSYDSLRAGGKVAGAQVMSSGKPSAVGGIIEEQVAILNNPNASYKQKKQAAEIVSDLRAGGASPYASPANKTVLDEHAPAIEAAVGQFFIDPEMHRQAEAASRATETREYAENIFAPQSQPVRDRGSTTVDVTPEVVINPRDTSSTAGGTVSFNTGSNGGGRQTRTTPDTEIVHGADSARNWFGSRSGRAITPDEINAQQADQQNQAQNNPENG